MPMPVRYMTFNEEVPSRWRLMYDPLAEEPGGGAAEGVGQQGCVCIAPTCPARSVILAQIQYVPADAVILRWNCGAIALPDCQIHLHEYASERARCMDSGLTSR